MGGSLVEFRVRQRRCFLKARAGKMLSEYAKGTHLPCLRPELFRRLIAVSRGYMVMLDPLLKGTAVLRAVNYGRDESIK